MYLPHPPLPPVSGLRGSGLVVQKLHIRRVYIHGILTVRYIYIYIYTYIYHPKFERRGLKPSARSCRACVAGWSAPAPAGQLWQGRPGGPGRGRGFGGVRVVYGKVYVGLGSVLFVCLLATMYIYYG